MIATAFGRKAWTKALNQVVFCWAAALQQQPVAAISAMQNGPLGAVSVGHARVRR
jgi:hypothetical protein